MGKTAKKSSPYAGRIAARGHFRTLRLDTPFSAAHRRADEAQRLV